jgi:hypothetical protein
MLKLSMVILLALVTGICLLQLRQQRVELGYQNQRLHRLIQARQVDLWNQQIQIAASTAPQALVSTVGLADDLRTPAMRHGEPDPSD